VAACAVAGRGQPGGLARGDPGAVRLGRRPPARVPGGKKQYGDPFVDLAGTEDEEAVRLRDAIARGAGTIRYTYDLGACWEHEITLEQTLARDPRQEYPVCVAYKGDSLVEYWSEDDPGEPEPFDMAEVNRELAALDRTEE
jgi:hypothetical protein